MMGKEEKCCTAGEGKDMVVTRIYCRAVWSLELDVRKSTAMYLACEKY